MNWLVPLNNRDLILGQTIQLVTELVDVAIRLFDSGFDRFALDAGELLQHKGRPGRSRRL